MRSINFFATRRKSRKQLPANSDFGTLGLNLVHDLSSSITSLLLDIERLRLDSQAIERAIQTAREQVTGQETGRVNIGSELRRCVHDFSGRCEERGIQLSVLIREECSVIGSAAKLQVVLNNLVRNAIDAVGGNNEAWVQLRLNMTTKHIIIEVADNGQGISERQKAQLFNLGKSTKSEGHLGVGLVLVQRIIERDFNGAVRVTSTTTGTCFQLALAR